MGILTKTWQTFKIRVWLALISTLWRSLSYPLPALNLTKEQCEKIMAPALDYAFSATGTVGTSPGSKSLRGKSILV